ncbi:MAG: hypothetical protein A2Y40_10275 [Candidatus Margulisbacteria bacterium GWF2_35_9]|nr:MAG: hypothetical protein A2Y40_10275 [Candidatus Margulisbacteria bacterium GWF2_35_9]
MKNTSINILIIEDNPGDLFLFKKLLDKSRQNPLCPFEYSLFTAECLEAAKNILLEKTLDIIISDLNLPDAKASQTIDYLKGIMYRQPIIILTSSNDFNFAMLALQSGLQDYLVKDDITSDSLARAIRYSIERHKLICTLKDLAVIDELTNLNNRRGFNLLVESQVKLMERNNKQATLLYIDLNKFKAINDQYGHKEGDQVLMMIANLLKSSFRSSDIIARLGGDEFVVFAVDTNNNEPNKIKNHLRYNLKKLNSTSNKPYEINFSIGTASWEQLKSLDELLQEADNNMYLEKEKIFS